MEEEDSMDFIFARAFKEIQDEENEANTYVFTNEENIYDEFQQIVEEFPSTASSTKLEEEEEVKELESGGEEEEERSMTFDLSTCETFSNADIMRMICVMEVKFMNELKYIQEKLDSINFQKMKRKRTSVNRCQHINRKRVPCNGYCCKQSSSLCYPHYVLMTNRIQEASYLYGQSPKIKDV